MKAKSADLLSHIRNGKELSLQQKISLVVRLSIPAILAQITSIIMQYIDASMVGKMGAADSAAIGLVASTTWLFGCVCSAGSAGFYIQAAQYIGAKELHKVRTVMKQAFAFLLPVGILLALLGIGISGALPSLLGGDVSIQAHAGIYFRIYACGLPFMAVNSLAGGLLQSSGNMKIPSLLNSLMCILDVILNAFFIFPSIDIPLSHGSLRIFGMGLGVAGAALGTLLAQALIAICMLYFLLVRSPYYKKDAENVRNSTESVSRDKAERFTYIKKAVRISLPIAAEHIILCSAYIATTKIIAPLGIISIAANSFGVTAESLCYMPAYGIASAATTLTGQSIGADRKKMALSFGKITITFGILMMALSGAFMYCAAPLMIGLLTPDSSVRALGIRILRIEAFAEPLFGASIVVNGNLRGASDTLIPSILNLISMWCVRIPLSYILSRQYGLVGVWIAMCVELCFRGTIFLIRFAGKRWMNKM